MSRPDRHWPAWKRLPAFTPVPIRTRADGWTPLRQARFIGFLAETGSVAGAAARVGCSRESAYRLRRKPGAESFADAWDAACGRTAPSRKFTFAELKVRAFEGAIRIRMYAGRYCGASRNSSDSALLSLVAAVHRAALPPERRALPGPAPSGLSGRVASTRPGRPSPLVKREAKQLFTSPRYSAAHDACADR